MLSSEIKYKKNILNMKTAIFIIAVISIALICITSNIQLQRLLQAGAWVNHTYEVMQTTEDVLRQITLAESQARSYLIEGDEAFLAGLDIKFELTKSQLVRLAALTADNSLQQMRVKELDDDIDQRIILINKLINYKDQNRIDAPGVKEEFDSGVKIADKVNALGAEIMQTEANLLQARNESLDNSVSLTSRINFIGDAIAILLLFISVYLFITELKRSHIAEAKMDIIDRQLRSILNSAKDMISVLDQEFRYVLFNAAYEKGFRILFGKQVSVGVSLAELLKDDPESRDKLIASYRASFTSSRVDTKRVDFNVKGSIYNYEIVSNQVLDDDGNVTGVIHIVRNITDRIKEQRDLASSYEKLNDALQDLKERNEKTTLLLEMSDVMLACASVKELSSVMVTYCSKALDFTSGILYIMPPSKDRLEQTADWGQVQANGKNFSMDQCWALRMGHIHYVDGQHTKLMCDHVIADKKSALNYICVPLRAQNDIYGLLYVEILPGNPIQYLTDNERLLVTTFAEVAAISLANVRLRENLKMQSMCDPLTGLYNRRYLNEFLLKQIFQSERTKMSIALIMLDLDHFKKINDVYGHDAGDIVLKEFSQILQNNIRPGDFAARYGGEEFIIVLYNMDAIDAKNRAETIRKAYALLKVKYAGEEVGPLSVSIGISIYPQMGRNQHDLISAADKALYAAKESGRNKAMLFSEIPTQVLSKSES